MDFLAAFFMLFLGALFFMLFLGALFFMLFLGAFFFMLFLAAFFLGAAFFFDVAFLPAFFFGLGDFLAAGLALFVALAGALARDSSPSRRRRVLTIEVPLVRLVTLVLDARPGSAFAFSASAN